MNRRDLVLALGVVAALGGCDKPKERHPPPGRPPPNVATLPALPDWAQPMAGKSLAQLFPGPKKPCLGNTDAVELRFPDGVKIVGWAWDPATRARVPRILTVDAGGVIAGAGETGLPRSDVTHAVAIITDPNTGWAAFTRVKAGTVQVFGVVDGGKSVCGLGGLTY